VVGYAEGWKRERKLKNSMSDERMVDTRLISATRRGQSAHGAYGARIRFVMVPGDGERPSRDGWRAMARVRTVCQRAAVLASSPGYLRASRRDLRGRGTAGRPHPH